MFVLSEKIRTLSKCASTAGRREMMTSSFAFNFKVSDS
jgi:hypothetical protein